MSSENMQDKILTLLLRDWRLILILITIFAFYYYCTATHDFFKNKGIAYMKPVIVLGNIWPRLTAKKSFHESQIDISNYFKGKPYGGVFEGRRPVLYVFNPELLKAITIRDFDYFVDRSYLDTSEPRYFHRTLDRLRGSEWKGVRRTMTPVFSAARMKHMMPLVEVCSKQMIEYFKGYDHKEVELKSAIGRYTLEVIGACAFGIKCDALTDENSHFAKLALEFNDIPTYRFIMGLFVYVFLPKLVKVFNVSFFNVKALDELRRLLQTAKAERRSTDSQKSDFLQILVDVAKKEQSVNDDNTFQKYMDEDTIDGQCLIFLLAGFETTSTLLSFAIHMLATKPEIQEKLRAHIQETTEGKELTYEMLQDLDYLDAVLLETLRMYPPLARVDRVVTKPYTLPGSKVQLDVGDVIAMPIYGIHMDPNYYPEPHEFRPERFMGEEKKARPSHLFLAFGAGPRNCIGYRFAMMSAKISMVHLMKNFKFTKSSKTENSITFNKKTLLLKPESGIWIRVQKL